MLKTFLFVWILFFVTSCGSGNQTSGTGVVQCQGELCYESKENFWVTEGDIILESTESELVVDQSWGAMRTRKQSRLWLWPSGEIPYEIDPKLPSPMRIQTAINHYHEKTAIRFIPRTTQSAYVVFEAGTDNCMSYLGRTGSRQPVVLAESCSVPNVIHEIGHVLGYYHEQSRSDRDSHIKILWENVADGREENFKTKVYDTNIYGIYDFVSIMHYSAFAFSKNGKPTIVRRSGYKGPIGNAVGLSLTDIEAIADVYGTRSLP